MKSLRSNPVATSVFILPALLTFSIVITYPLVRTLFMSFYDWDGLLPGTFIGFDNFIRLFKDELFYVSLRNGFIFAIILTVFQLGLGTFLALTLMNNKTFGRNTLRRGFFIPVVLSVTVVCQLWLFLYNPEFGFFNRMFEALGLQYRQDWLSSLGVSSIVAVTFVASWQYMGYQLALIYAGAKSIPDSYYEAAKIDGASTFQTHMKITIPLMAETYKICLIFCINGGLNAFAHMQIMTKGGPGTATYSMTYMMYRSAFKLDEFGYGCAVAVVLVLQCLLITYIVNKYMARERITY
ncbi:sugar ABC transporter permease [Paenibacillus psychroresistens]|uniref:Sugar ABC transporter permease n=1 Tax=Paenibacillus psychroresistens TaxID=1778678 RepID=A0A6B8RJ28_9BACL|nr:sugar ABC transporter permease [Paenibacillus psychroresistens]QGQ96049.1 sugar ABC transporter permease [Paenibacillus psychroresistens]